jgi:ABC-type transport system substrate-binding protein
LGSPGGKILRVGIDSPVTRVFPRESDGYTAQLVCRQIFEPPFDVPIPGHPFRPLLFEDLVRQDTAEGADARYIARIREGLCFSDGTPVEPLHVVDSLAGLEERNQIEVRAAGDGIEFRLHRPNPNFHLVLTQTYWALSRRSADKVIGTGPFRMREDSSAECIRLERNPFYRAPVPLDGVEFLVYPPEPDGSKPALIKALEQGEVDLTMSLDHTAAAQLNHLRKWLDPGSSTCNLYFNTQSPPFSDRRARLALCKAVNRRDLSAAAYGNALAFAAKGPVPPLMGEWLDEFYYDMAEAKNEWDALGPDMPRKLRMLLPWAPRPYLPNPRPVIAQIEQMLGHLGLELDFVAPHDLQDFRRKILAGQYELALLGWNADTPDPADFLEASLATDAIPEHERSPVVKANWSRFSSEAMEAALRDYREAPDAPGNTGRERILALLSAEAPMLPLLYAPTLCVHRFRVRNLIPNPFGIPSLAEVDLWT